MPQARPYIERVVEHNGGCTELSRRLGDRPSRQQIGYWLKRGWASPSHIFRLEKLLPAGVTVRHLFLDRERLRRAAR